MPLYFTGVHNNTITRILLDPWLTTRAVYKTMHSADGPGGPGANIVQDLLVPFDDANEFIQYVQEKLGIWPIWVCSVKRLGSEGHVVCWPYWKHNFAAAICTEANTRPITESTTTEHTNRRMEEKSRELRGMKVLYAEAFCTEDDVWSLYDRREYERLRKKWKAETLPSVWGKVMRKERKRTPVEEGAGKLVERK